jgi:hypothetical protein
MSLDFMLSCGAGPEVWADAPIVVKAETVATHAVTRRIFFIEEPISEIASYLEAISRSIVPVLMCAGGHIYFETKLD